MDYVTVGKMSRKTGKSLNHFNNLIVSGYFKDVKKDSNGRNWLISIEDFEGYLSDHNYILSSYSIREVMGKLNCTVNNALSIIRRNCVGNFKKIRKQIYVRKEAFDKYILNKENQIIIIDSIRYISTTAAAELIGVSNGSICNNIKKHLFEKVFRKGIRYWICEEEVLRIKETFHNSIELSKIDTNTISAIEKKRMICNNEMKFFFPNAFLSTAFRKNAWIIPLSDLAQYELKRKESEKKRLVREENNPVKLFKLLLADIKKTPFVLTRKTYEEYSLIKINKTRVRNIRNYVFSLIRALSRLLKSINKEIYLFNDNELIELINNPEFTSDDINVLQSFFKFCITKLKHKCRFTSKYNSYHSYKPENYNSEDSIYPVDKWIEYTLYLTDIDLHIIKAFNSYKYSKLWLYTILHLSITWRREDILNIPSIDIENIEQYSLEWFENNTFTMYDAQLIVNGVKHILSTKNANKNSARSHFIIYPMFIIPTAISFIIAEHHRKQFGRNNRIFGGTKYYKADIDNFFVYEHLKGFNNTKANRSLLTYNFQNAVTSEGMAELAYSLSTFLRSHKLTETGFSETTAQYIYSTNSDGDANNIAFHLFKRGYFGWLYHSLLDIAYDTREMDLDEITNEIWKMKSEYSPFAIESFSSYIISGYEDRKAIIKEMLKMNKKDIKKVLFNISRGEMPSKIDYTQCLKYEGGEFKCPYINCKCTICTYAIPTNYTLSIIKVELENLISKLEETDISDLVLRKKYTFQIVKLLTILKEAKDDFENWGSDYINSFLNLKDLYIKVKELEETKFIPYD